MQCKFHEKIDTINQRLDQLSEQRKFTFNTNDASHTGRVFTEQDEKTKYSKKDFIEKHKHWGKLPADFGPSDNHCALLKDIRLSGRRYENQLYYPSIRRQLYPQSGSGSLPSEDFLNVSQVKHSVRSLQEAIDSSLLDPEETHPKRFANENADMFQDESNSNAAAQP